MAEDISGGIDEMNQNVTVRIAEKLCETVAYIAVFLVSFILVIIVFTVIANIVNLTFSLPGLDLVNKVGGSVFGGISGIIIIIIVAWACRFFGLFIDEGILEKSFVLRWLMNSNLLAAILGV